MIPSKIDAIQDEVTRKAIEDVHSGAQGVSLELDAAPTATAPVLQDNERGIYSGALYERKGNTIYVFTPSSTITIT
jgi:hypothetical protein